jgi:histidinol dehydrogenase
VIAANRISLRRINLARTQADPDTATRVRAMITRGAVPDKSVREGTRAIVDSVRADAEAGVRAANARFGGGLADGRLALGRSEMQSARDALTPNLRSALEQAIEHVSRFAEPQLPRSSITQIVDGVEIERRWSALRRVGCYVPGGSAPYPSSLVMTVVPARVAGVEQIIVASPASADGTVDPVLLGAAGLLDVDRFVVAGGAQAVAALAFGLPEERIPAVDRIVGPGNAWVTAAKLELAGEVGIDLAAGPSEGMVLAAPPADARVVAADVITQAEHGPDSPAILVTIDRSFGDAVEREIEVQLATTSRHRILERSLNQHGAIVVAPDLDSAIEFINEYAPEHLSVDVEPLEPTVTRIRNAGSVFVGRWAPESAGDYATGANHVLPTGGLARASSALSVDNFGKYVQVQRITRDGLANLRDTIGALASAEGLLAHRAAVEIRFNREGES